MSAHSSEIDAGADRASARRLAPEAKVSAPRLLALGGIVAALGAASCCVIPFALFLAGVSGAWIGNLTALEPYQPIFAGVSVALIGYGAFRLRQKRKMACASGYCVTPRSDRVARIGLWTAAALVAVAVVFPYAARHVL